MIKKNSEADKYKEPEVAIDPEQVADSFKTIKKQTVLEYLRIKPGHCLAKRVRLLESTSLLDPNGNPISDDESVFKIIAKGAKINDYEITCNEGDFVLASQAGVYPFIHGKSTKAIYEDERIDGMYIISTDSIVAVVSYTKI